MFDGSMSFSDVSLLLINARLACPLSADLGIIRTKPLIFPLLHRLPVFLPLSNGGCLLNVQGHFHGTGRI